MASKYDDSKPIVTPTPPATSGLTPLQETFCYEYLKDFNATAAIRRANNDPSMAITSFTRTTYTKHPAVKARIRELQLAARERTRIDVDTIVHKLDKTYSAAMDDQQYGPAVRALELLGKHLGMFVEKSISIIKIAGIEGERTTYGAAKDINLLLDVLGEAKIEMEPPTPTLLENS